MGNLGEEDMRPLYTTFETSNKLFQTKIFFKSSQHNNKSLILF